MEDGSMRTAVERTVVFVAEQVPSITFYPHSGRTRQTIPFPWLQASPENELPYSEAARGGCGPKSTAGTSNLQGGTASRGDQPLRPSEHPALLLSAPAFIRQPSSQPTGALQPAQPLARQGACQTGSHRPSSSSFLFLAASSGPVWEASSEMPSHRPQLPASPLSGGLDARGPAQ